MNMKMADIITFCSWIASGGLTTIVVAVGNAWPASAQKIALIAAIIVAVAGGVVKLYSTKAGAPATAIVADAAVVPDGTQVVHATTPVIATNISSTSSLLPSNGASSTKGS